MITLQTTSENRLAASPVSTIPRTRWIAALALPLVVGPTWCWVAGTTGEWLGTLAGFVLLAVLTVSAITDLQGRKIFNFVTYSAVLWALVINIVGSVWPTAAPEWLGSVGIGQSFGGAVLCFLITLAGYHMSGRGAGDVKLATAIGALLGVHAGVFAVAYSYIVAAVAIIVWSIYSVGPLALVKAASRAVGSLLGPLWPFPPSASDKQLLVKPIPLGPYFLIGTILVVLELVPV
jgi:prepilin peptidase CpaA